MVTVKVEFSLNTVELEVKYLYNPGTHNPEQTNLLCSCNGVSQTDLFLD